jgi:hypothetical protein
LQVAFSSQLLPFHAVSVLFLPLLAAVSFPSPGSRQLKMLSTIYSAIMECRVEMFPYWSCINLSFFFLMLLGKKGFPV